MSCVIPIVKEITGTVSLRCRIQNAPGIGSSSQLPQNLSRLLRFAHLLVWLAAAAVAVDASAAPGSGALARWTSCIIIRMVYVEREGSVGRRCVCARACASCLLAFLHPTVIETGRGGV